MIGGPKADLYEPFRACDYSTNEYGVEGLFKEREFLGKRSYYKQ
jgi:hypothetical protein